AQNGGGEDSGGEGPPEPGGSGGGTIITPRNPIDGGLGFLVILGIGYAVKSIRKEEE
ncbi:MAG TPA: branched chain amino acid ABC transporter substrate-binding protein, partial [Flavobacteriaceae bacterium]|nr:branched chain amino acid ABC transporter substrate-binding protein [Flavobacteriaceae bacterium]